ncbi:hypothetical protein pEaSNUABM27_00027 [Erwinia phage pEa_SNUABM_27]|nr:hypothetical protein pEaSNUABM27_00027 [Erwinia phage pEa_SNUABM_27]
MSKCYFCTRQFGLLEVYYPVRKQAVKNGLWVQVGKCCDDCWHPSLKLNIKTWEQ